MKKIIPLVILLALFFPINQKFSSCSTAFAEQIDTRVSFFYNDLRPYGDWFWHQRYGWCWYPYNVSIDWRPYSNGYWVFTDYGWEWVANEPWGWACFHYGRWFYDDDYGWCWYPDTVWAPSWCLWRYSDDWIGWAPLPPEAVFRVGFGVVFSDRDADDFIPHHAFCFVRERDFVDRDLRHRIADPARNVTVINQTHTFVNNIKIVNNQVVNELPVQSKLEKDIGHPLQPLKTTVVDTPARRGVSASEVWVFRPDLTTKAAQAAQVNKAAAAGPTVNPRTTAAPSPNQPTVEQTPVFQPHNMPKTEQTTIPKQPAEQKQAATAMQNQIKPSHEMTQRHEAETRALQQYQQNREQTLQNEHLQEINKPPKGITAEQLKQQHEAEINAAREQAAREQQMLKNYHSREQSMSTVPEAPPHQRFNLPTPVPSGAGAENTPIPKENTSVQKENTAAPRENTQAEQRSRGGKSKERQ